jgi:hypothetical protein
VDTERGALDVVLMAFGRPQVRADSDSAQFQELEHAIADLASRGVAVVMSAGNDHGTDPSVPACFAAGSQLSVFSVGSGRSEADHDSFSNHGAWVNQWRSGNDVVGIMPLWPADSTSTTGYARWSGTSFAAARFAGERAYAVDATRRAAPDRL